MALHLNLEGGERTLDKDCHDITSPCHLLRALDYENIDPKLPVSTEKIDLICW